MPGSEDAAVEVWATHVSASASGVGAELVETSYGLPVTDGAVVEDVSW